MNEIIFSQDIRPLSDFRASTAACIKHLHESKRPMILTQRGRGVAVVLDIAEYENMKEKLEIIRDLEVAEQQISYGEVLEHDEAMELIKRNLKL